MIKKLYRTFKKLCRMMDRNIVVSLGENCLSDDILARNGLKSFSSPYAAGRSNIEYILAFENERFADFLNAAYLCKETYNNAVVVRNKKYMALRNTYNESAMNGFEFTHHDVLEDANAQKAMGRRCRRMLRLRGKNIVFLYHHRLCAETDHELLLQHLNQLADLYRARGNEVTVCLFAQSLTDDPAQRRVEHRFEQGVHWFTFHTLHEWAGTDEDIFWARCDEDLIHSMIQHIRQSCK